MDYLRFAKLPKYAQEMALEDIVRGQPILMELLTGLRDMDLPDWMLVSGGIYNVVWNYLTGRAALNGVKDFDIFYFDDGDLSYEAEDLVIGQAEARFSHLPLPVEVRNQARVHLWAPKKFNHSFPPLKSSEEMLSLFASKTHAVGVRLMADDSLCIVAPFGLEHIFSFCIAPNHALNNQETHEKKARRAKGIWPELNVEPW